MRLRRVLAKRARLVTLCAAMLARLRLRCDQIPSVRLSQCGDSSTRVRERADYQ